jgi:S-adenosylmethionine hydrolase
LLWLAAERLGGIAEAFDIGRSPERLEPVSATFHGRDIFAPVAAALACGTPPGALGEPMPVKQVARLQLPRPSEEDGALRTHVLHVDHFGNLTLDATDQELERLGLRIGGDLEVLRAGPRGTPTGIARRLSGSRPAAGADREGAGRAAAGGARARYCRTFGEVAPGELVAHEDSRRMIALAVNEGTAAELLEVSAGDEVILRPR